jgi:phage gp29-like protein
MNIFKKIKERIAVKAEVRQPVSINKYQLNQLTGDVDLVLRGIGRSREYLKILEFDAEVYQCMSTRSDFVSSTPLNVRCNDQRTAKFITEELQPRFAEIMTTLFEVVKYGYTVTGIEYRQREDGLIGLGRIVAMPIEHFTVEHSGRWRGTMDGIEQHLDEGANYYRLIPLVRNPTYENPKGDSLLSRSYWSFQFKRDAQGFWAQWLERFGMPLIKGSTADGDAMLQSGKTRIEELADSLAAAYRNKVIALNDDQTAELDNPPQTGNHFEIFDATFKDEIQKIWLGSGGVTNTANNNRASGQTAENTLEQKINADLRLMAQGINAIIERLIKLNNEFAFASFSNEPCTVEVQTSEDIRADVAARDDLLYKQGVRFTPDYYTATYGIQPSHFTIEKVAEPLSALFELPAPETAQKFTPEQQTLEEMADGLLASGIQPIDPKLIIKAIESIDPQSLTAQDDLKRELLKLVKVDNAEFTDTLYEALFSANLAGYGDLELITRKLED